MRIEIFMYIINLIIILYSKMTLGGDVQTFYRSKDFVHNTNDNSIYYSKIKPILDKRCVVCHSCNESPCQLKLESIDGLLRGAKKASFQGNLFTSNQGNRLFVDATHTSEWRKKGFYSILEDFKDRNEILAPSIMMQTLLKKRNELVINKYTQYLEKEIKGMPYGMANLDEETEFAPLMTWLASGAPLPEEETIRKMHQVKNQNVIAEWEEFFNDQSFKGKWTARYLYEHLFEIHFYFEESPGEFFELVRSKTAYPEEVVIISSAHENDDPSNNLNKITLTPGQKFYYRLRKINSTIVFKNHILYKVNKSTLIELKNLFIKSNWGENNENTIPFNYKYSNPFVAFEAIPATIRYTWMLRNAEMLMKVIMSGPNCRVKNAGSMIWDNYLQVFIRPESDVTSFNKNYFKETAKYLPIPNTVPGYNRYLSSYATEQKRYAEIKMNYQLKFRPNGYLLSDIWNGGGVDKNSLITVFRHMDYATAHSGHLAEHPHSVHLFNYSSFERLYYLCVITSTFRDSAIKQVPILNYLFDLKKELDEEFLSFMPAKVREVQKRKYTSGKGGNYDYDVNFSLAFNENNTIVKEELDFNSNVNLIIKSIFNPQIIGVQSSLVNSKKEISFLKLRKLNNININIAKNFPENSYIKVINKNGEEKYFTLLVDRYHDFLNHILTDNDSWNPTFDQFQILDDIQVDFPNKMFIVNYDNLDNFIEDIQNVSDRYSYKNFDLKYGLQKKSSIFWKNMDLLQSYFHKKYPIEAGIIDLHKYGRYDSELPSYVNFTYKDDE